MLGLQLASSFEAKSAGMAPLASATDIFGGLWHVKAVFESATKPNSPTSQSRNHLDFFRHDERDQSISISDAGVNSAWTGEDAGAGQGEWAHAHAPWPQSHVCGASTASLTPQAWMTMKEFWWKYFVTAGADLISYSPDCETAKRIVSPCVSAICSA